MQKDELLKRFKKDQEDEGIIYIENRSSEYGFKAMLVLTILLMLYQKIKNQPTGNVVSIMFSFLAFSSLRKYKDTKKREDLITGIYNLFLCLTFITFYLVETW